MICSKCGANMPDSNKFCVRCGNKLESACPRCGTAFKPNAKFCVKCGMKRDSQPEQQETPMMQPASAVQETPVAQPAPTQQETPTAQPAPVQQETPATQPAPVQQATPVPQPASMPQGTLATQPAPTQQATPVPQQAPMPQGTPAAQPAKQKKSAKNPGPIILIIILVLLVIALAGGYTYFVKVLGKNPIEVVKEMISSDEDKTEEKDRKDSPKDKDADDGGKTEKEENEKKEEIVKGDVTLLDPAGKLAEQAGKQLAAGRYTESDGAIDTANEALQLYMSVAEANHLEEEAKEGIVNTFRIYSDSVIGYCDTIKQQGAYVAGFNEISNKLSQAMELLTAVTAKGYTLDGKALEAYKDAMIP